MGKYQCIEKNTGLTGNQKIWVVIQVLWIKRYIQLLTRFLSTWLGIGTKMNRRVFALETMCRGSKSVSNSVLVSSTSNPYLQSAFQMKNTIKILCLCLQYAVVPHWGSIKWSRQGSSRAKIKSPLWQFSFSRKNISITIYQVKLFC